MSGGTPGAQNGKAGSDTRGGTPRVGGFEIIARIGKGGMGAVFRARQMSMDRMVALKILPPQLARDQSFVARFLREAQSAARLNHPNIVQAYDAGKADGYHYFAMELVDGKSLREELNVSERLPERRALEITRDIGRALEYAHGCGIIHRDVKPENILITAGGVAKLADLGLARETAQSDSSLTQSGAAVGTPNYISPEQVRGEKDLDGRCDIYSLGATLYHALVGGPPFAGGTGSEVMAKHLTAPVPNPRKLNPGISYETARIVVKALAKEREKRYATVSEMLGDIDRVLATPDYELTRTMETVDEEPEAAVEARPVRRQQWLLAAAVIALFAAATFIGVTKLHPQAGSNKEKEGTEEAESGGQGTDAGRRARVWPEQRVVIPPPVVTRSGGTGGTTMSSTDRLHELLRQNKFAEAQRLIEDSEAATPADTIRAIREGVHNRAEARMRMLFSQATAKAKANDFAGARALIEEVKGFDYADLTQQAERKLGELTVREQQAALWAEWEGVKESAAKLTEAKKFDEAVAVLTPMTKSHVPEIVQGAKGEIGAVELARVQEAEALLDGYRKDAGAGWELIRKRDYDGARKAFADLRQAMGTKLSDPLYALVVDELAADEQAPALAESIWEGVEKGVDARKGSYISFPTAKGDVVEAKNGEVTIKVGESNVKRPVREMLARQALGYLPKTTPALAQAVFMIAEQVDLDKAAAMLDRVPSEKETEKWVAAYRNRIEWLRIGPTEQAAKQLWTQITRLRDREEDLAPAEEENLQRLVRRFESDYGKTQFAASVAKELAWVRLRLVPVGTDWPFDSDEAKDRQRRTAEALGCPMERSVDLGGGVKLEMVLVPAGEFVMGRTEMVNRDGTGEGADEQEYRVRITQPFYMSKYEITTEQWRQMLPDRNMDVTKSKDPVDFVSWFDCQDFIAALNKLEGGFRLPTEAEWEYACRAGTDTPFAFGDHLTPEEACFRTKPMRGPMGPGQGQPVQIEPFDTAKAVGSYKPNAFGLYDMHGNVAEWCYDVQAPYPQGTATDPQGPASGMNRVFRGGAFVMGPVTSFRRMGMNASSRMFGMGFRVVAGCAGLPERKFDAPKPPAIEPDPMKVERLNDKDAVPNLRWIQRGWFIEGESSSGRWCVQLPFQLRNVRREQDGWALFDANLVRQAFVDSNGTCRFFKPPQPPPE